MLLDGGIAWPDSGLKTLGAFAKGCTLVWIKWTTRTPGVATNHATERRKRMISQRKRGVANGKTMATPQKEGKATVLACVSESRMRMADQVIGQGQA
jgi:hypothetical protein